MTQHANIVVNQEVHGDQRIACLAELAGWSVYEAFGRIVKLWARCAAMRTDRPAKEVLRLYLGPRALELVTESMIAEVAADGAVRLLDSCGVATTDFDRADSSAKDVGCADGKGASEALKRRAGKARAADAPRDARGRLLSRSAIAAAAMSAVLVSNAPAPGQQVTSTNHQHKSSTNPADVQQTSSKLSPEFRLSLSNCSYSLSSDSEIETSERETLPDARERETSTSQQKSSTTSTTGIQQGDQQQASSKPASSWQARDAAAPRGVGDSFTFDPEQDIDDTPAPSPLAKYLTEPPANAEVPSVRITMPAPREPVVHAPAAAAGAPHRDDPLADERAALRKAIWSELEQARKDVATCLGERALPLLAQDPGELALAMRMREARDPEQLALVAEQARHAIRCAQAEAKRDGSMQWLQGVIFEPRNWRRFAAMTLTDAQRKRSSSFGGQNTRYAPPPERPYPLRPFGSQPI